MTTKSTMYCLIAILIVLAVGSLFKWLKVKYIRPASPPDFQREILDLIWNVEDQKRGALRCRNEILEKFTFNNLCRIWFYRFEKMLHYAVNNWRLFSLF